MKMTRIRVRVFCQFQGATWCIPEIVDHFHVLTSEADGIFTPIKFI